MSRIEKFAGHVKGVIIGGYLFSHFRYLKVEEEKPPCGGASDEWDEGGDARS
jgi:hypothetical protein